MPGVAPRTLLRFRMTIDELLQSLAAIPEVRRIPSAQPVDASVMVGGIEVAHARAAAEPALRRLWRERHGSGALPLLLVTENRGDGESILTLGPLDSTSPVRAVNLQALSEVLARISPKPRLEAVRELTAELERLDESGIPGLKAQGLLSQHTLQVRLRRDHARWSQAASAISGVPASADWRGTLNALGYELERRQHRGYLARFEGRPVAVVHPKSDPADFSRLDSEGRPPEGVLLNDCFADGAAFGMLAHGSRLRLFEAAPVQGSPSGRYLELDPSRLRAADRPFLFLLAPEYLVDGRFRSLQEEARAFGVALRSRLD